MLFAAIRKLFRRKLRITGYVHIGASDDVYFYSAHRYDPSVGERRAELILDDEIYSADPGIDYVRAASDALRSTTALKKYLSR